MDKTASMRLAQLVARGLDNGMSKEAGWWDNLKQWTKDRIEDPTGIRTNDRKNRVQQTASMQDSYYIKPPFSPYIFATPASEEREKHSTHGYNMTMADMYRMATNARGNKPYRKDTNGNYAPAPGVKYK